MQTLALGQRFSKWFWITVLAVIGFGLLSNFGPMALLACGFIALWVKGFIWAARNSKGILLYGEDGKQYRAFEVGDTDSHRWMDEHIDPAHPDYVFRHHDE